MTLSPNAPTPAGPSPEADVRIELRPAGLSTSSPKRKPRRRVWLLLLLPLGGLMVAAGGFWQDQRVRQELRQAQVALARHDLSSAASHLDQYLERRPHDSAAWFLAGRTARRLGRFPEAERYLKRCQELAGVTDATRLEWDLLRVEQGDLSDIHTRLRMTITPDHPDAAFVLEALARGYVKCDRLQDALQACDMLVKLEPDQPWPRLWRGGIFERLANYHQALADYQRALANAPEDRDVRLALAMLFARARQPTPAAEHFEYLLDRSAEDREALLGLAACRIEQGRPREAVPLLERVLADEPVPARGLFLRGKAALEQHDAAGAESWLTQAVREAPDDAEALHQLILALRAQGKQPEGDRLAPRLEALRQDLARLNELIRLIARNPDDAAPRHEAGVVALRLRRHDEGVRWLQSALRAKGDHRPIHAALAEHFRQTGDARAEAHRLLAQTP